MFKIEIINNFLKKEDLSYLNLIKLNEIKKNKVKIYHNIIDKKNKIIESNIKRDFLYRLHKNYHAKAIKILKNLCPDKAKLYEYSEFQIIETGANYKFPIHDDTPNKLLSGVIYLRPSKNFGTIFYKNKAGANKKVIKWKINRAVFFSRSERETWHSYRGDGKSNRVVLVYNLMTKNIRRVYEIEKKNYFLGLLRFKLNPILFKFCKKLI